MLSGDIGRKLLYSNIASPKSDISVNPTRYVIYHEFFFSSFRYWLPLAIALLDIGCL